MTDRAGIPSAQALLVGGAEDDLVALARLARAAAAAAVRGVLLVLTTGGRPPALPPGVAGAALPVAVPGAPDPVELVAALEHGAREALVGALGARLPDALIVAPGQAALLHLPPAVAHPHALLLVADGGPDDATLRALAGRCDLAARTRAAARRIRDATGAPPRLTVDDAPARFAAWLGERRAAVAAWRARALASGRRAAGRG